MHFCSMVVISLLSGMAVAQDAAQQMQMQQAQQQLTQQQLDLVNQQQLNQGVDPGLAGYRLGVASPRLKQEAGTEPGTVLVRMEARSRGASIFYTTDGWTPTAASKRYLGPITLRRSTTVRAIAFSAGGFRSRVSLLPVNLISSTPVNINPGPIRITQLSPGTKLPLIFSASVSSRGEKVGDRLPVSLADDLFVDGKLAAQKGAAIEAVVTNVDNSHVQGLPGVLSFSALSLRLRDGTSVPLLGVETMEGTDHTMKANVADIVPLGGLMVHGKDAVIPAGQRFEAQVTKPIHQSASASQIP
jgi:hypothetical protein